MESEETGYALTVELPESLVQWLNDTADDLDVSRQRLLSELLAAHRTVHEEDVPDEPTAERIDDLHDDFMEKLADVRERVVQIKRETDEKAPADHDHADLRDDLDELRGALDAGADDAAVADLPAELDDLRERVDENRDRLDSGFENYEEVLEYLTETTDELDEQLDVLARALVSVRDQTRTLATQNATRAATAELAKTANRLGITTAKCGECEQGVTISLLTEPSCPHCGATFEDVEPKKGFFRSNWLVVGRPPALDGDTIDPDVDDLLTEVTEE